MRYLVQLYGDETAGTRPGAAGSDAEVGAGAAIDEMAGEAIVAGDADRAAQLARWHHQDHARGDTDTDELDDAEDIDDGDVLTRE